MHKKKGTVGIIVTALLLTLIVVFSNVNTSNKSYIESAVSKLIVPIQNGLTYLKNKISGNNSFFTDINNLKKENEELQKKNSELEQSLRELEMIKAENSVLKEYAKIAEKYPEYETVPGYVINEDYSNYSRTIIINVGKNDGIEENMTVIADSGLVGHVISVTDTTAKVQTIIDSANSISSTVSSSRQRIVCKGMLDEKNLLKASYIETDAILIKGDHIETSGIGGIYPKGIHIGEIEEIIETKNITDRYALIKTAVDFSKLEAVLVIKR